MWQTGITRLTAVSPPPRAASGTRQMFLQRLRWVSLPAAAWGSSWHVGNPKSSRAGCLLRVSRGRGGCSRSSSDIAAAPECSYVVVRSQNYRLMPPHPRASLLGFSAALGFTQRLGFLLLFAALRNRTLQEALSITDWIFGNI